MKPGDISYSCLNRNPDEFSTINSDLRIPASDLEFIVFDAVGTLIRPRESISRVYQRMAGEYGVNVDQQTVKRRFRSAREDVFSNAPIQVSSESLERERWSGLVRAVFPEMSDTSELFQTLWQYYSRSENWMIFDDVPDTLRQLLNRDRTISIASNFDSRLLQICRETVPLNEITNVFCSSVVGYNKPDRRFYDTIAEKLNSTGKLDQKKLKPNGEPAKPNNLIMIGDDLEKDVVAARSTGWQAIHLDRTTADLPALLKAIGIL